MYISMIKFVDYNKCINKFNSFKTNYEISQDMERYDAQDRKAALSYAVNDARDFNAYRWDLSKVYPEALGDFPLIIMEGQGVTYSSFGKLVNII